MGHRLDLFLVKINRGPLQNVVCGVALLIRYMDKKFIICCYAGYLYELLTAFNTARLTTKFTIELENNFFGF